MSNIDNYADVLESYLIPAEEGMNIDSVRAVRNSSQYREILATLKRTKVLEKAAKKSKTDIAKWKAALEEYKKVIPLAAELKKIVDEQPEPVGFWQKLCAVFTPIFEWKFPEYEITDAMVLPTPDGGVMVNYTKKSYGDDMSESTNSRVKEGYQHRMNLFLVRARKKIREMETRIAKLQKVQGN